MADNQRDPTSEAEAADVQPTSSEESGQVTGSTEQPEPDRTPQLTYEQLQEKYAASSREARRLLEERNQFAGAYNAVLQQQQQFSQRPQSTTPQPQVNSSGLTDAEEDALAEARLDDDRSKIKQLEAIRAQRVQDAAVYKSLAVQQFANTANQRSQMTLDSVLSQPELFNDDFKQAVWNVYTQKMNNPLELGRFQQDTANWQGVVVNPHVLREAFLETRVQSTPNPQAETVRNAEAEETHLEPPRRSGTPQTSPTGNNARGAETKEVSEAYLKKVLPKYAFEYVARKQEKFDSSYTVNDYWKGLSEEERDEFRRNAK